MVCPDCRLQVSVLTSTMSRCEVEGCNRNETVMDYGAINIPATTDVRSGAAGFTVHTPGTYRAELAARDGGSGRTIVQEWVFEAKRLDTADDANGPGGRGCLHGFQVDDEWMDESFGCNCTDTIYVGDNCDIDDSAAGTTVMSKDETGLLIAAIMGAVVAAMLIALVVLKRHLEREKHKPADVAGLQAEILAGLGLSAPVDIGPNEIGLSISFDCLDGLTDASEEEIGVFENKVLNMLGNAKSQRVAKTVIAWADASITVSASVDKVQAVAKRLVRRKGGNDEDARIAKMDSEFAEAMGAIITGTRLGWSTAYTARKGKRSKGKSFFGSVDIGAGLLTRRGTKQRSAKRATKRSTVFSVLAQIGDIPGSARSSQVVSVMLAIPKRVAKSFTRRDLLRLGKIGEGSFAEVYKGQLTDPVTSTTISVAVKTVKNAVETSRDDLLHEAAIMALFVHPNVIKLIGVITTPTDMPAMILMPYCEDGTLHECISRENSHTITTVTMLSLINDVCKGLEYLKAHHFIHRDVATRNVLLDAAMNCMLCDFDGATAITGDADEASGTLQWSDESVDIDQLPVRWSAVEVLAERKFSPQSDVWSLDRRSDVGGIFAWSRAVHRDRQHDAHRRVRQARRCPDEA